MRGIDTNVLARAFGVEDDAGQVQAAQAFLLDCRERREQIWVDHLVLVELVWLMRSKRYGWSRGVIADALTRLLEVEVLVVEGRDLVRQAIADYRRGGADFFDSLLGCRNRRSGCGDTVTFDRALEGSPGFTLLETRS